MYTFIKKNGLFVGSLILLTGLFVVIHLINHAKAVQTTADKFAQPSNPTHAKPVKVLTPAWSIAATLTQLDNPPIGIGDKKNYDIWVAHPAMPKSVVDLGLRYALNPEMVASLQPDLIVDNSWYETTRRVYDPNTPIEPIEFGRKLDDEGNFKPREWAKLTESVQQLGQLIAQPKRADAYIEQSQQQIIDNGAIVQRHIGQHRKIAVTNFYSVQQINTFGNTSLIQLGTDMMGLELISIGNLNSYGFSSVPIHRINELPADTCLIIVEPISPLIKHQLKNSLIWQDSQFSQPDSCMYIIKPVWNYGGINVLLEFSNNLKNEVVQPRYQGFTLQPPISVDNSISPHNAFKTNSKGVNNAHTRAGL